MDAGNSGTSAQNSDSDFLALTQSTDTRTTASTQKKDSRISTSTQTDPDDSPSVYRCTLCSPPNSNVRNARNIIVCIDGTSNQFGRKNTNVVKLFAQVDLKSESPAQHAYYSSGIGTRPRSFRDGGLKQNLSDYLGLAIAWNVEEIVKDAYSWLARTYQEGDRIYLFGFSRGAFQVRVLAGMIHEVGLIRTLTKKQIGTAYEYYRAIRSKKPKTRQLAREFKRTFSWEDLRVHFVGVWDTVSSVGLIKEDVFLSTSSSAAHACYFRHALALDELRVKFMPEYFHEMNSESKYKCTPTSEKDYSTSEKDYSTSKKDAFTITGDPSDAGGVKEVWFAGSHSDVGGTSRPGSSYQAGNVSLLWMRKEAAEKGLVLKPTEMAWVPDDLDFGTSNSMNFGWRIFEYLPVKHQTCFNGAGENTRRLHRSEPRRIVPGQKVHTSVLYAWAYKPLATLGEGFDVPLMHVEPGDKIPESEIWEDRLFDDTVAQGLLKHISDGEGIAPIYFDRLLFMLRFEQGRESARKVAGLQVRLRKLVEKPQMPFVGLVALVAYYEAACDRKVEDFEDVIYDNARKYFLEILAPEKHPDGPRVIALLKTLTKHDALRSHLLTEDVLESLLKLLDRILKKPGEDFGYAMNGLSCLLLCDQTRGTFVKALKEPPVYGHHSSKPYRESRLSRILMLKDPRLLIAALRMVLTLARISDGYSNSVSERSCGGSNAPQPTRESMEADKEFWFKVKRRVRQLAQSNDRLVGRLAVEISLALYSVNDPKQQQLSLRDSHVRTNFASALISLKFEKQDSADGNGSSVSPERKMLQNVFGFDTAELNDNHKKHIGKLQTAVKRLGAGALERTAGTLTLLKLCETKAIRDYLCEIEMLDVWVSQLQSKGSALLAAYALVTCLEHCEHDRSKRCNFRCSKQYKYPELVEPIKKNKDLAKYIVRMLLLDHFDDAIGQVEGFQVFRNFMEEGDLRKKIQEHKIVDILGYKLKKGKPKETRTSLICLEIFLYFEPDGPWAKDLVGKGLEYLRHPQWTKQKAGVTILSALVQTQNGVNTIKDSIPHIINWLLPDGYRLIREVPEECPLSPSERQPRNTCSWMMGPACVLQILASNEEMRIHMRGLKEYSQLKNSHLIGALVSEGDTPFIPGRIDVSNMLDNTIKAVDEEKSGQSLMSIEDEALPQIEHWRRSTRNATRPYALTLGAILFTFVVIVASPIYALVYVPGGVYRSLDGIVSQIRNRHLLDGNERTLAEHADESAGSGTLDRLPIPHGNRPSVSNRLRARIGHGLTAMRGRLSSISSTRRTNPRSSGSGDAPAGSEDGNSPSSGGHDDNGEH